MVENFFEELERRWGSSVPDPEYVWMVTEAQQALATDGAGTMTPKPDCGQSEARVQSFMHQATAGMTRRYPKQKEHGENARALDRILRGVT